MNTGTAVVDKSNLSAFKDALAAHLNDIARAIAEFDPALIQQRDAVARAEETVDVECGCGGRGIAIVLLKYR